MSDSVSDRLTYGKYLRIPELLALQTPRQEPPVPGEMLFIIGQQAQELWFKQILFDLHRVIDHLTSGEVEAAVQLLLRLNRILGVLSAETEVLQTLPPIEFREFRPQLRTASGFESEQFRELEIASGLRDDAFLRMAGKLVDVDAVLRRWPISMRDALVETLRAVHSSPLSAAVALYSRPSENPVLYSLVEACSEYDLAFADWRFQHTRVVERVIGDLSPGTAGSSGSDYLRRTLRYRFFPELWDARNHLTLHSASRVSVSP